MITSGIWSSFDQRWKLLPVDESMKLFNTKPKPAGFRKKSSPMRACDLHSRWESVQQPQQQQQNKTKNISEIYELQFRYDAEFW